jgi:hypothetical protein
LVKSGVITFVGGKGVIIPTAMTVSAIAVQGGCIAWTEGESGHTMIKAAFRSVLVRSGNATKPVAGRLVKSASGKMIYLAASDGKRYAFASENIFKGWYADFLSVETVPMATLIAMPLSGNVLYPPNYRLVRSTSSSRVYAVSDKGVLHWIRNGQVLKTVYGSDWNRKLDTIPDTMFADYTVGQPIDQADMYYVALASAN